MQRDSPAGSAPPFEMSTIKWISSPSVTAERRLLTEMVTFLRNDPETTNTWELFQFLLVHGPIKLDAVIQTKAGREDVKRRLLELGIRYISWNKSTNEWQYWTTYTHLAMLYYCPALDKTLANTKMNSASCTARPNVEVIRIQDEQVGSNLCPVDNVEDAIGHDNRATTREETSIIKNEKDKDNLPFSIVEKQNWVWKASIQNARRFSHHSLSARYQPIDRGRHNVPGLTLDFQSIPQMQIDGKNADAAGVLDHQQNEGLLSYDLNGYSYHLVWDTNKIQASALLTDNVVDLVATPESSGSKGPLKVLGVLPDRRTNRSPSPGPSVADSKEAASITQHVPFCDTEKRPGNTRSLTPPPPPSSPGLADGVIKSPFISRRSKRPIRMQQQVLLMLEYEILIPVCVPVLAQLLWIARQEKTRPLYVGKIEVLKMHAVSSTSLQAKY